MTRIKLGKAIERWRAGDDDAISGRVTFQLEETYCMKGGRRYGPYGPYWYVYYWTGSATPPMHDRPGTGGKSFLRGRGKFRSRYVGKPGSALDPEFITAKQLGALLQERGPVELRDVVSPAAPRPAAPRRPAVEAITLIACAATKGPLPVAARSLYRSDWFLKARAYAEARQRAYGDPWFILSAKHGLVSPDAKLAPYDYAMKEKSAGAKREWAEDVSDQVLTVAAELDADPMTGAALTVRVLAGEQYRRYLVPMLEASGFNVLVPMRGLGIGKQKQWLVKAAAEVRAD